MTEDLDLTVFQLKTEIIQAIDDKLEDSDLKTTIHKDTLYVPLTDIYDIINTVKLSTI